MDMQKRGFTLIELLIIIAIIGILAAISLISLSSARAKARQAEFKSVAASAATSASISCEGEAGSIFDKVVVGDLPAIDQINTSGTSIVDNAYTLHDCDAVGDFAIDIVGASENGCSALVIKEGVVAWHGNCS